jgi:EmrB/QacA subfamily drug resistance transporter
LAWISGTGGSSICAPSPGSSGQPGAEPFGVTFPQADPSLQGMKTHQLSRPSFLSTRRGQLTLVLLCAVALMDFVDASIVNIALPSIQRALHFSVPGLQWVTSGYLLTYGGFMLLGGRAADLLGRRRVLVAGVVVIGVSSLAGGLAVNAGVLVGARLVQGLGAALTLPAALSILTSSFREGKDRHTALGVWAAVGGLASAAGVLAGGLLTEGPGWRWVMFVNPIACAVVLGPIFRLISGERPGTRKRDFDVLGAVLATAGPVLLIYALVRAPAAGWSSARTIGLLFGAAAVLAWFVVHELRHRNPLAPLSIFRINGLGFADITQLTAFAGFLGLFFFLTLYLQEVLGYSPIRTGLAYLPLCGVIAVSAGVSSQLLSRVGTRPVIVVGAVIAAGGLFWLSHLSVHASYRADILPGLLVLSAGFGPVFVGTTTAANAGVPADKAGLAAALLNASQQIGGALGLAIFTAAAATRTQQQLASHLPRAQALTSGFHLPLLLGSFFILSAAVVALRATNTRDSEPGPQTGAEGDTRSPAASVTAGGPR